jgi:hypothetical protein
MPHVSTQHAQTHTSAAQPTARTLLGAAHHPTSPPRWPAHAPPPRTPHPRPARALAIQQYSRYSNTALPQNCCITVQPGRAHVSAAIQPWIQQNTGDFLLYRPNTAAHAIQQNYSNTAPQSRQIWPLRGLIVMKLPPTCHVEVGQHIGCTQYPNSHV